MSHDEPVSEPVRWLLSPSHEREKRLLEHLATGEYPAKELKDTLNLRHDAQLHRAIDHLEDHGLIERWYHADRHPRGNLYTASTLGKVVLQFVQKVEGLLEEEA